MRDEFLWQAKEVGRALEEGKTLPAAWYTHPAVFAREQERIFERSWHYLGHTARLQRPGDFITGDIGRVPIVVVRDTAGILHGFVNVCRHRGHLVAAGEGNRKSLQCPYHAWTYGLDGQLLAAPRANREAAFDREAFALMPLRVDTWGSLIFVNADLDAPPLTEALGGLPALVAKIGLDPERLTVRQRDTYTIEANWKVYVENSIECYHCPTAHPGFSDTVEIDPDRYRLQAHDTFVSHTGWLRSSDPETAPPDFYFYYLWPTLMLAFSPDKLMLSVLEPLDSERTRERTEYYFAPEIGDAQVRDSIAYSQQVVREDLALVASVQRGLRSARLAHGVLLMNSEHLLHDVQRRVLEALR